ncbi:MAG: hypothetical protein IKO19_08240 [Candidatus Riflebacteria bacterium]|nr:hypothetical protein [Candidatus Riflebacteria bacterium]
MRFISIPLIIILLTSTFMLLAINSAKDTTIKNNQIKYGINLVSTIAIAAQGPIISQSYDEFLPFTESITKNDTNIQEVSFLNLDGKYLANKTKDKSTKLGQTVSPDLKKQLDTILEATAIENTKENSIDFIAPIQIGSSRFGTAIIRFDLISTK